MIGILSDINTIRVIVVVLRIDKSIIYLVEFNVDGHHFFAAVDCDFVNVRRVSVIIVSWYLCLSRFHNCSADTA